MTPEGLRVLEATATRFGLTLDFKLIECGGCDFRFAGSYTGLECFEKAGEIIAWNDGEPVVTPYDNCVLVMPSLRQLKPGVTVARLGQLVS